MLVDEEGEAGNADSARAGEERGNTKCDEQDRQERSAEQPFDEDAGPPGPNATSVGGSTPFRRRIYLKMTLSNFLQLYRLQLC